MPSPMSLAALAGILPLALSSPAAAQGHNHPGSGDAPAAQQQHHQHFDDPAKWTAVFDDPARDAWQKPHEIIQALNVKATDRIADIGAGTGYFAMRLARHAPQGTVFAVDLAEKMVAHLAQRAKTEGLANVRAVRGSETSPNLPEPVDLVLLVDVYHHIEARPAYFRALRAALRPGGRVAIVDFRPESPVGAPKHMRLSAERIASEMTEAGYRRAAAHDFLPYQNFLVFEAARP